MPADPPKDNRNVHIPAKKRIKYPEPIFGELHGTKKCFN